MSSKGIGRILQFGIAKETTRGTANASATFWVPFDSATFDEMKDFVVDEQNRGVIEDSVGQSNIRNAGSFKVSAPLEDKTFPLILYATFGTLVSSTDSDGAGTVRDHTITVAQSAQHQSLSLYADDPLSAQDYSFANGAIDKLTIKYELKKFLSFEISAMSKAGSTTTNSPSVSSQNRYLPQHLTFSVNDTYAHISTGTAIALKSLQLNISTNIESDDVLGSVTPADFLNKQFVIEGTLEALWQNESDFKTAFLAGTQKAVRIALVNTDVTIGSSAHPTVQIDLAKVIFTELTRPLVLNDLVKQTLKFKAHYSITDSLMASILCKNLQGSY